MFLPVPLCGPGWLRLNVHQDAAKFTKVLTIFGDMPIHNPEQQSVSGDDMGLFASKMEKDLKALAKIGPELEVRYPDSDRVTFSVLMTIYRNSIVILGFTDELRSKDLELRFVHNRVGFRTTIEKQGRDKNGRRMFHCTMPDKLMRPSQQEAKNFRVFPQGGDAKVLISTNRGNKSVMLPIYAVGFSGITLVNQTDVHIKVGTKLFQSMVKVTGAPEILTDLIVVAARKPPTPEVPGPLLICLYEMPPRHLDAILSAGQNLTPKKPPSK